MENNLNSIFLQPTNEREIFYIINKLKNTVAVGFDEIPTNLLKYTSEILGAPLSILINKCFAEGTFPEELKISIKSFI